MPSFYRTLRRRWRTHVRRRKLRDQETRKRQEWLAAHPDAPPKRQVVICGFPRSGTTLLYNLLCSTMSDFAFEEFEEPAVESLLRYDSRISKRPFDVFDLARFDRSNIHDKKLHVILSIRDPRDMVVSRHAQAPDVYFMGWDQSLDMREMNKSKEYHFTSPGIRQIADAIRRAPQVLQAAPLLVRYEDLVSDPDVIQSRLAESFDLEFNDSFSQFCDEPATKGLKYSGIHKPVDASLVKINEPINAQNIARWRQSEHVDRVLTEFEQHPELFALLDEYGYAENRNWYDELKSTS